MSKNISELQNEGLYNDLLNEFINNGNKVYAVTLLEKRDNKRTSIKKQKNAEILQVECGNYFDVGTIEKGITLFTLEKKYLKAISKYWDGIKFDLLLYSTPPITFNKIIKSFKKKGVYTYLMLKDIFPQNAVDINMLSNKGVKGILYKYFRYKEKKLYSISDTIGCMSQANVDYILKHNTDIEKSKVEICPNSIKVRKRNKIDKQLILNNYGIPNDKVVFVYGGNLGKPQGPEFILSCLKKNELNKSSFFLIVGDGSEFNYFKEWFNETKPKNCKLIKFLPKEQYMELVSACDVGMIFLDHRFTIPNFPSRLLPYMEMKMPVFAVTDSNTDVGKVIIEGNFGFWCSSNDLNEFNNCINRIIEKKDDFSTLGNNAYTYLLENYNVEKTYRLISEKING